MTPRRHRFRQTVPLQERLIRAAKELREEAKQLPSGHERDVKLRKARHDESAADMTEWLTSPGLRPPI